MKNSLAIFSLFLVIFASSCGEDDDNDNLNNNNNNTTGFYMRCKIDGQSWEAQTSGLWNAALNIGFIPALTGYGTDGDSQVTFNFDEDTIDEKSYYFSRWSAGGTGFDDTIFCSYSPNLFTNPFGIYYVAKSGYLTISDINWADSVATGTFAFVGEKNDAAAVVVNITNGEFKVPVAEY